MNDDTKLKVCCGCGEAKPATREFYAVDTRKPVASLRGRCKACTIQAEAAARQARLAKHALRPKPATALCRVCLAEKPLTAEFFHPREGSKTGYRGDCKVCTAERTLSYRQANAEKLHADARERHQRNKEEANRRRRERYHADPAARRAYEQERKEKHGERRRAEARARTKAHPERDKARCSARRAARAAAGGSFTAQQFADKVKAYGGRCHWCGEKVNGMPTADHLIPLRPADQQQGGSNDISNIVPACAACNFSKKNKLPHQWSGRLL